MTHALHARWALLFLVLAAWIPAPASAQNCEFLIPNQRGDGTVWAHTVSTSLKFSSGSAELGFLDLGPPGPPISGFQGAWLEWTPNYVLAGLMGGGLASASVTQPPGTGGLPITDCLGVATLNGGWILTTNSSGSTVGVRPCTGAFIWTTGKLYLFGLGGAIATVEVTSPSGASIPNVLGVCIIDSFIADYSTTTCVVAAAIHASALVFTPTNVYHVSATLSGGLAFTTTHVLDPSGAFIPKTRGIVTIAGGPDGSSSPPIDSQGAAVLWNDAHVYLVRKTPLITTSEIFNTSGGPIAQCWGVMKLGTGSTQPIRAAGEIWQQNQAWIVTVDPTITVAQATQPPGGPPDPSIQSGVVIPAGPPVLLVERQAGYLYEILGSMQAGGVIQRAMVVGHNQRDP